MSQRLTKNGGVHFQPSALRTVKRNVPLVAGRAQLSRSNTFRLNATGKPGPGDSSISSKLEVLEQENELLKEVISATEGASETVVDVPDAAAEAAVDEIVDGEIGDGEIVEGGEEEGVVADTPEEFWTPSLKGASGEYVDDFGDISPVPGHDGTEVFKWDDTLWSHADHFKYRWNTFKSIRQAIDENEGGLAKFAEGYKHYGLNRGEHEGKTGIWYREWAPGAKALCLIGEFNNWSPADDHWAFKNEYGVWELFLADNEDGSSAIPHRSKVKARLENCFGEWVERIPAWIKWATQEWDEIQYNGVYYEPPQVGAPGELSPEKSYTFKYPRPERPESLRIYECHVGMSSKEPKVNSYIEFKEEMLPRIRQLGYNAIQIMAIQEHAYYGSFGYHVTNFFAPSSRCGTPDELKAMIDEAHRLGIVVLMDIVHSHASKNAMDGLNLFDGSDAMYFHSGGKGYHWVWDSRLFNYGNWETLRFLLSNARWWMDEFKFDGYRFDGVTSMMYTHHGLQMSFSGHYDEYFGMATDTDAVVYLMLCNNLLHDMFPTCITIGEDVSGMPTFCRPWQEGGVGFDYRLQMAIADKWIEVLGAHDDFAWNMGNICFTLTNRRYAEKCVAYAESHDQALVGDKTIAFWLMDKDMYDSMSIDSPSMLVDRGIALHKMIRLVTMCLGGDAYLNFMGNEFGHPEWIDFPRDDFTDPSTGKFVPGNGGSLEKCRRRWDLADAEFLKYKFMNAFDRAINHLDKGFGFIKDEHTWISRKDEGDKLVVCERGDLVFVFNFHPTNSYTDYRIGCKSGTPYKVVLTSDEPVFGGYNNVSKDYDVSFTPQQGAYDSRDYSFCVYAPSRTVSVYAPAEYCDARADSKATGVPGLGVARRGPNFAR